MELRVIEGGGQPAANRHFGVTVVSLPGGISGIVAKAKLPQRPPAPPEPRSFFLPIAGVIIAAFALVAMPALSAAANHEAEAEAAPPAAEEVKVTVAVHSTPEGAAVKRGDETLCTTPCDVELTADEEAELHLEMDGFVTLAHTFTPVTGAEPLALTLEAAAYQLAVEAPEGATVTVNGETPENAAEIDLGAELAEDVEVVVSQRGFRTFRATLNAAEFGDDRRHAVTAELAPVRRAARPAATAPAPEPAVEPEGPVPANPF
ncbi:MAG: PEGA domain-containing protein [Myxococcota bacterium]